MDQLLNETGYVSVFRIADNHRELLHRALPNPADTRLFDCLMTEARRLGMSWIDGLEYVIAQRRMMLN
jgi:hypothetical protein